MSAKLLRRLYHLALFLTVGSADALVFGTLGYWAIGKEIGLQLLWSAIRLFLLISTVAVFAVVGTFEFSQKGSRLGLKMALFGVGLYFFPFWLLYPQLRWTLYLLCGATLFSFAWGLLGRFVVLETTNMAASAQ